MKRIPLKLMMLSIPALLIHSVLLRLLAGTNIIAGVFCPGPHLPGHYPILIALFVLCRLYVVLLPGFILSWLGLEWMKWWQSRR